MKKKKDDDTSQGRRFDPRHSVNIGAKIQVPLDDQHSAYIMARAVIENVSLMGVQVCVTPLHQDHIPYLSRAGRACSLNCHLPGDTSPMFLAGKIAWVDLHDRVPKPYARMGLHLKETAYRELCRLSSYLRRLEREK